ISSNQIRSMFGDEPWEYGGDDPCLNGGIVPWGTGKREDAELDAALLGNLGKLDENTSASLNELDNPTGTGIEDYVSQGGEEHDQNKSEDASPVGPILRWHKTPDGHLEARGVHKWRIDRVPGKKGGAVSYSLT